MVAQARDLYLVEKGIDERIDKLLSGVFGE